MAIKKTKKMLQIPVEQSVAKAFTEMAERCHIKKGELFTMMFADFIQQIKVIVDKKIKQRGNKDGNKEKSIKS